MITDNFKTFQRNWIGAATENVSTAINMDAPIKDIQGTKHNNLFLNTQYGNFCLGGRALGSSYYGDYDGDCLWIGTGTQKESASDYMLSAIDKDLITDYSNFTKERILDNDKTVIKFTRSFTINNTTEEAITVSEVGLLKMGYYNNQNNKGQFLAARHLIPEQKRVTIEPGETKTVTRSIAVVLN